MVNSGFLANLSSDSQLIVVAGETVRCVNACGLEYRNEFQNQCQGKDLRSGVGESRDR